MRSARILRELAALTALVVCAPETARAITWPDVADSVERDLAADDVATRLAAARKLSSLGRARGAALAILAMDDGDEDVRLVAADAAIRLKAQGATERASAWLNAPSARTRRKACEVAGSMPNARAVAALARALGDPNAGVRIAAAWALGRQSPTEAVAPLLGRLDDADPAVRIAITTALTRLHDPRAVIPLIGKVGDSSIEVRQAVVRALGELGDLRASSPLVAALRDGSVDVRREAVTALGLLRAADAADAIAGLVPDHSTPLRLAALAALARIATPEAISRLVAALGASDEAAAGLDPTPVREALASAGPSAIAALHACLLASKSPGVASGAAWVLGALRAHAEAPTIVASLRAGWLPPAFAMRALAGAGTSAEAPVVLEFVTDPSAVVRGEAMSAAMALLDPTRPDGRAVEPLAAALADSRLSSHEHARVARLLGRTGARRVAPLLASWVRSGDPELRLAAIDALGALGPAGADEALLDVLRSSDPSLRLRAAEALSLSGGSAALTSILAQLDADEEVDRAALVTAAGGILARIPSVEAVGKLEKALLLSVGPERDALLVAIGRAPVGVAVRVLGRAARSEEPMDRGRRRRCCRRIPAIRTPSRRHAASWRTGSQGSARKRPGRSERSVTPRTWCVSMRSRAPPRARSPPTPWRPSVTSRRASTPLTPRPNGSARCWTAPRASFAPMRSPGSPHRERVAPTEPPSEGRSPKTPMTRCAAQRPGPWPPPPPPRTSGRSSGAHGTTPRSTWPRAVAGASRPRSRSGRCSSSLCRKDRASRVPIARTASCGKTGCSASAARIGAGLFSSQWLPRAKLGW